MEDYVKIVEEIILSERENYTARSAEGRGQRQLLNYF